MTTDPTKLTKPQVDLLSAVTRGEVRQHTPIGSGASYSQRGDGRKVTAALAKLEALNLAYADTNYRGDGIWRLTNLGRHALRPLADETTLAAIAAEDDLRLRVLRAARGMEDVLALFSKMATRAQRGDLSRQASQKVSQVGLALAEAIKVLHEEASR